jgi:hypothetical protein
MILIGSPVLLGWSQVWFHNVVKVHPPTQEDHGLGRGGLRKSAGIVSTSVLRASADFAHWRMTHRSLSVGGYFFWGPRTCPWGSI